MAAQRLGEQRPRHGRVVQRRRVELHELHVGDGHAGPQGHGHAVAGRLGRVGGDREQLAGAAGGQHDVGGPDGDGGGALAGLVRRQRRHPDAAPALDDEVEGEPPLEHGARRAVGGVDQGPLDLGARRRAAGVHDAGPRVAALAGQGERARGLAVEHRTERDELVHPGGALVDEDAHRLVVAQAGAGAQRVGQVQVGRVLVAAEHGGHPALGPAGGGLRQLALGQHPEGQRGPRRRDGFGETDRGRQPGDAAAQDQDVEGSRPGLWAHAGSVRGASSTSRRADASSITRFRPSTCTTRGHVALELGALVLGVGDDDHLVPGRHQTGGRTVETDLAALTLDGVRLEARAVVDVEDGDLLVGKDVGQRHELGVDGDRADVVEVGAGDGGAVDLGLHHAAAHRLTRSFRVGGAGRPGRC